MRWEILLKNMDVRGISTVAPNDPLFRILSLFHTEIRITFANLIEHGKQYYLSCKILSPGHRLDLSK
jgi:hypothetical protein